MTSGSCACGCGALPPPECLYVPGHVLPARRRPRWVVPLAVVAGLLVLAAALPDADQPSPAEVVAAPDDAAGPAAPTPSTTPTPPPATTPSATAASAEPAPRQVPAAAPLLVAAAHGDGDSWRDTHGREYRLGLVNTPEQGECFGAEATAERKARVAAGFRAQPYAVDRFGREVSVVTTATGLNLNVHLARHGFADDRYLGRFRHENPALARQLDAAFAAAKAEGAGLWSACRRAPAPQGLADAAQRGGDCHPDYLTCIPVQGDGSGRGDANDLDCGQLDGPVRLRQAGVDPYRLDADGDGTGCD